MTQEDKELLLKDLCARLPYDVNVLVSSAHTMDPIRKKLNANLIFGLQKSVLKIKPYLFPISSMTFKQIKKVNELSHLRVFPNIYLINWYLENHFDIYGFIEMGLAIDATGKNIY